MFYEILSIGNEFTRPRKTSQGVQKTVMVWNRLLYIAASTGFTFVNILVTLSH